jgi:ubiquitin-conjugating enzyme E2 D/E
MTTICTTGHCFSRPSLNSLLRGVFSQDIKYPPSYPFMPPEVRFTTPIYHANISSRGTPHLFILKENWSPALSISSVGLATECLLEEPNTDNSGDNWEAALLSRHDRRLYEETAQDWTRRYAGLTEQHDKPVS